MNRMNNLCYRKYGVFWIRKPKQTQKRRGNKQMLLTKRRKTLVKNDNGNNDEEEINAYITCVCWNRVFGFIVYTVHMTTLSYVSSRREFTSRLIVSVSNSLLFFM